MKIVIIVSCVISAITSLVVSYIFSRCMISEIDKITTKFIKEVMELTNKLFTSK